MNCCPWLDFITSVRRMWRSEWGDIDQREARIAWGRYAAMPGEFVTHVRRERGLA